ncbi:MAG TPA: hypothetical protein ENO22_00675 [candidate division Zixibacteria bacterium]|nr:hypothetical protein [candidate division Zixibacteria bacterium]
MNSKDQTRKKNLVRGVPSRAPRVDKVNNGQSVGQISVRFDTVKSQRLLTYEFPSKKDLYYHRNPVI